MTTTRRLVALALLGALAASGCSTIKAAATSHAQSSSTADPLRYVIVGNAEFRSEVRAILNSPTSWTDELVTLAEEGPIDFYIWLVQASDGPPCGDCNYGNMVAISAGAWYRGRQQEPNPMTVSVLRRFIINHEVGHQLGNPDNSGPCSVMNPKVCPGEWPIDVDDYLRTRAREWLAARPPPV